MSSSDSVRSVRLRAASVLFVLMTGALAACTVQPVYAPGPSGSASSKVLNRVAIDPVGPDRVGQVVRNKLMFALNGGPSVSDPVYRMRLVTSVTETPLGLTNIQAAPTYSVGVTVTYELTKIGSTNILLRSTARGSASYDRVNSEFANARARIDAENRAAEVAADDIRLRVAAAAAKGI